MSELPNPDKMTEIRYQNGEIDEIVAEGKVHMEQMDEGHWFIGIETEDEHLSISLSSRGKIKINVDREKP